MKCEKTSKSVVTGKEFRIGLGPKQKRMRMVAPFSQQTMQPNTKTGYPPSSHLFRERNVKTSLFRKFFDRGDIPIARAMNKGCKTSTVLMWRIPPECLDYAYYLPVFFDGLSECQLPYKILARAGVEDMLTVGGDKVLTVIPQLIIPIKTALNTRNPDVIIAVAKAIRLMLMTGPYVGKALVPYYRQILSVFNMFCHHNVNIGDKIEFNSDANVADHIEETLHLLEKTGGKDAYINIKYMVPTYESYVKN